MPFIDISQIAKFMGPTWGPPGSCRPQMGPMMAAWTLLWGMEPLPYLCPSLCPCFAVCCKLYHSLQHWQYGGHLKAQYRNVSMSYICHILIEIQFKDTHGMRLTFTKLQHCKNNKSIYHISLWEHISIAMKCVSKWTYLSWEDEHIAVILMSNKTHYM